MQRLLTLTLLLSAAVAVQAQGPARNAIVMIGDGTGTTQLSAASAYSREVLGRELHLNDLARADSGRMALMATEPAGGGVTDSAAAATAMATGYKVANGVISVDTEGRPYRTVLEDAQAAGKAVGLVSTTAIVDATPAAFGAHVRSRREMASVAEQYLNIGLDVILGGGRAAFLPEGQDGGQRPDARNLLDEFGQAGYTVVSDRAGLMAAPTQGKLLGLFAGGAMNYSIDRDPAREPTLAEMTRKAIEILSRDPDGFFLLVEAARIDHAGHANDVAGNVFDTLAFDQAIGLAHAFAAADRRTLVLVTGDHETGGMAIGSNYRTSFDQLQAMTSTTEALSAAIGEAADVAALREVLAPTAVELSDDELQSIFDADDRRRAAARLISDKVGVMWVSGSHSGTRLPLFGFGPGAERVGGLMDNTDLSRLVRAALFGADRAEPVPVD